MLYSLSAPNRNWFNFFQLFEPIPKPPREDPVVITSLPQIRALASPARQEIIDALSAMGPVSIAELARTLGRRSSALYFHFAKLEKLCLVVRRHPGSVRRPQSVLYRERESALFDVPSRPMTLVYRPSDPKTKQPMAKLVKSMASMATRSFVKAYQPGAVVNGFERNLWASRSKRRLTSNELERLNRNLSAVVGLLGQSNRGRGGQRQLIEVTFVLAPAPAKPPLSRRHRV